MDRINIDNTWTLFLDRDGVINKKVEGGYIQRPDEFEFIDGVLEAVVQLANVFSRIVIVTNQQGIGKGLMSEADLAAVHAKMLRLISERGGRVDKIYYAPQLQKENSPYRKPNTGMGEKAKEDFPEIDFAKSIMVGDSYTDLLFAEKLGMRRIFIGEHNDLAEYCFPALQDFTTFLIESKIESQKSKEN